MNSSQPFYKRVWFVVLSTVVTSIIGICAWVLMHGNDALRNARVMPKEINETSNQFQSWLREDNNWTGLWSNSPEGYVDLEDMHLSDVRMQISMRVSQGEIDGEIATDMICETTPLDFFLLRGKVNFDGKSARLTVYDFIGGKEKIFSELDVVRDNSVLVINQKSGSLLVKNPMRLGKHPENDIGTEIQTNVNFCNRPKTKNSLGRKNIESLSRTKNL